jgi:DNA primase
MMTFIVLAGDSTVICESSIDCLSHYQLHGGDAGYVSLGGAIGARQRDLLTGLFVKAQRRSARVIVATDNDAAGEVYFEQMQLLSPFTLERQTPMGKDWNDDLAVNPA